MMHASYRPPPGKLLFVDDEASIRVTLSVILEREGFAVTVAASVPEALQYITQQQFDVLLADLNRPARRWFHRRQRNASDSA